MKIELLHSSPHNDDIIRKWIEVPGDSDISDILPSVHGKGLAEWQDDQYGGQIVEKYRTEGKLKDGKSYFVLSKNVRETMRAMGEVDKERGEK